jgi:hypothetical protein
MSNNSTTGSIASEVVVMAAVIGVVYGGLWAGKKLVKAGAALKASKLSKA